jgi:hypothetical protein
MARIWSAAPCSALYTHLLVVDKMSAAPSVLFSDLFAFPDLTVGPNNYRPFGLGSQFIAGPRYMDDRVLQRPPARPEYWQSRREAPAVNRSEGQLGERQQGNEARRAGTWLRPLSMASKIRARNRASLRTSRGLLFSKRVQHAGPAHRNSQLTAC